MRAPSRLLVILALALVVRLAVVAVAAPDYKPVFDAADYARHAESIAAGDGYPGSALVRHSPTAFRPPAYPYLLALVYTVTGQRWTAGLLAAAALGTLAVLLMYLVAERIWGGRVALVVAALAAVFPPLVAMSSSLLSEPLFVAIELGLVLAVLAYRRSGGYLPWAAAAGALAGLGALTRANGVLLALAAVIGVWGVHARPRLRGLLAPAIVVGAAALAIAPWTIRNANVFDRFVPVSTQAGFGLSGTYNDESRTDDDYPASWRLPQVTRAYAPVFRGPGLDEADLDAKLRRRGIDYAADHPGYVAESVWWNTLRMFDLAQRPPVEVSAVRRERGLGNEADDLVRWSGYGVGVVAVAGLLLLPTLPRRGRGPLFMWLIPVLMIVGAMAILGNARYRAPVEPFLIFLAALALVALWARARPAVGDAAP